MLREEAKQNESSRVWEATTVAAAAAFGASLVLGWLARTLDIIVAGALHTDAAIAHGELATPVLHHKLFTRQFCLQVALIVVVHDGCFADLYLE